VNPGQAEALTLANSEGRIQLVLRNNSDQQVARSTGWDSRELYVTEPHARATLPDQSVMPAKAVLPPKPRVVATPPTPSPAVAVTPAPRSDEIVVIRGNQKTMEAPPRMEQSK
jgi:hypothetical protein